MQPIRASRVRDLAATSQRALPAVRRLAFEVGRCRFDLSRRKPILHMIADIVPTMIPAMTALLLVQASAVAVDAAIPAAAPQRPVLPSSLSAYFEGRWSGSGTFVHTGKAVHSHYDFEPGLGGEDMIVHYSEEAPATFAYDGLVSVDSRSGQVLLLMAGNLKGGARLFNTNGWAGDKLVFQSVPQLKAWFALERFTFSREAPNRFRATYEMSFDNGLSWHVGDEQIFTKSQ